MSDTPRTDEAQWTMRPGQNYFAASEEQQLVSAHFARTLERELAASQANVDRLFALHAAEKSKREEAEAKMRAGWLEVCQSGIATFSEENTALRAEVERLREAATALLAELDVPIRSDGSTPMRLRVLADALRAALATAKEPRQ
jgi:hypothetical protein